MGWSVHSNFGVHLSGFLTRVSVFCGVSQWCSEKNQPGLDDYGCWKRYEISTKKPQAQCPYNLNDQKPFLEKSWIFQTRLGSPKVYLVLDIVVFFSTSSTLVFGPWSCRCIWICGFPCVLGATCTRPLVSNLVNDLEINSSGNNQHDNQYLFSQKSMNTTSGLEMALQQQSKSTFIVLHPWKLTCPLKKGLSSNRKYFFPTIDFQELR